MEIEGGEGSRTEAAVYPARAGSCGGVLGAFAGCDPVPPFRRGGMIIAIDARPLSYTLTGIGVYLSHAVEALQRLDEVNSYCLMSNAAIPVTLCNHRWRKVEGRAGGKLMSTAWLQAAAPLIARRCRADIFWGPRHHLPLGLPRGIKCVLTVHDVVHRVLPSTLAWPNLLMERLFMRWSLLRADRILADSDSTARDLVRFYGTSRSKIRRVYPGVPGLPEAVPRSEGEGPDAEAPFFLFVGTLDPRKNFVRLFNAFERLAVEDPQVRLVLAGDAGWKNEDFLRMLRRHPLRGRVDVLGYVSGGQLASLYTRAVALVLPSLYEGFGFPIVEAMAVGTPVITSRTGSMPEAAGDGALLVDPLDVGALAEAMRRVLGDVDLRRILLEKGRAQASRFSWTRCAAEILAVFEEVCEA